MDFVEFVKKVNRDSHDVIQQGALQRLGRALNRGTGIGPLLEKNDASLDPFDASTLGVIADAHREFVEWTNAAKDLRRYLAKHGLALPDGSRDTAFSTSEIEALKRISALCQRSGHLDHDAWATAVEAHVELWRAAVTLSLAHGSAVVTLDDQNNAKTAEFDGYTTKRTILKEMPGYKWLAIRRGVRSEILNVVLELPLKEIGRQTHTRLPLLGLVAEKRGSAELTKQLIETDLERTILDLMDRTAEKEALQSARVAYMSLLGTPPLQADKILSCFARENGETIGIAVLDKKGDVLEQAELPMESELKSTITKMCETFSPTASVLPISINDKDTMQRLEEAVAPLPIQRVHTAAIKEARKNLPFEGFVASAVVLGRRALKPGREWGRVNPLNLGLGEYPKEIDEEKLKQTLAEARLLSSWDRRKRNQSSRHGSGSGRTGRHAPPGKKMNPTIKTIRDLRPEMSVDGVVTNITRFGAFVNIGLSTEGMIHVSQLAIEFVDDPASIVRVGQQVKARVLEVIPEKERIALSLKPAVEHIPRESGPNTFGDKGPEKRNRQPPKTRSAALADLDALFKK